MGVWGCAPLPPQHTFTLLNHLWRYSEGTMSPKSVKWIRRSPVYIKMQSDKSLILSRNMITVHRKKRGWPIVGHLDLLCWRWPSDYLYMVPIGRCIKLGRCNSTDVPRSRSMWDKQQDQWVWWAHKAFDQAGSWMQVQSVWGAGWWKRCVIASLLCVWWESAGSWKRCVGSLQVAEGRIDVGRDLGGDQESGLCTAAG